MRLVVFGLMAACAILRPDILTGRAEACVIVRPVPEDVHGAVRFYPVRDLAWYLQEPESLDIADPETGLRPLMTALLWGKPKHFRELLRRGADPDLMDRSGNTTLIMAAQLNQPGLVMELLEAGSDPYRRNFQGQSFQSYLFMAEQTRLSSRARRQRALVVAWLIEHGVALEARAR